MQDTRPARGTAATIEAAAPTPAGPRRSTSDDTASRRALLDAAEQLMLEEGHAAVTARRVAAKAGLKRQLVHYYFASMDELFVGVVRRGAARTLELVDEALASPQPLRALWNVSNHPSVTVLSVELFGAARHRPAIRRELVAAAERFRLAQADALARVLEQHDADIGDVPVGVLLLVFESLARGIAIEDSVGMTTFHDDALAFIDRHLTRLEFTPTERAQ